MWSRHLALALYDENKIKLKQQQQQIKHGDLSGSMFEG
jgi:hypothetical protein